MHWTNNRDLRQRDMPITIVKATLGIHIDFSVF